MASVLVARFLVDRPIRPGMVRAILDTLTAQGGTYVPELVRRSPGEGIRRLTGARPARLLEEVGEGGTQTTFMRVSEAQPQPVLTFAVSRTPRTRPTEVILGVPSETGESSHDVDRLLGVCKGLYLFLESFWGAVGLSRGVAHKTDGEVDDRPFLRWSNFFGPELVSTIGIARLLTSVAFIVEILPDGGVMLVTHPTPALAESDQGRETRMEIEQGFGPNWAPLPQYFALGPGGPASGPALPRSRSKPRTTS